MTTARACWGAKIIINRWCNFCLMAILRHQITLANFSKLKKNELGSAEEGDYYDDCLIKSKSEWGLSVKKGRPVPDLRPLTKVN